MNEMRIIAMNKKMKRATLGLILIFTVFLILFILRHDLLINSPSLENFATGAKQTKAVNYLPVEPNNLDVTTQISNASKEQPK